MLDLRNLTEHEIRKLGSDQLDALVAKHVMGLKVRERSTGDAVYLSHYEEDEFGEVYDVWKRVPRYSTDIATAWEVVEAVQKRGWAMRLYVLPKGERSSIACFCFFRDNGLLEEHWASGRNPAEAICRAALVALAGAKDDREGCEGGVIGAAAYEAEAEQ